MPSFGNQDGPQLAFDEKEAFRSDQIEDASYNGGEIDRVVKNDEVILRCIERAGKTRRGGDGEDDGQIRLPLTKGANEFQSEHGFADADGVNPCPALCGEQCLLSLGKEAKSLAEMREPAPAPMQTEKELWQKEYAEDGA